jgi:hypothetical protein
MITKRLVAIIAAALAVAVVATAEWWYLDPRYYTARELEHQAYPARRVDIDAMPAVNGTEYFGKIRFDLYIRQDGRVERVENLASTMPAPVTERIVKAFREAKWVPGRMSGGRFVRSVKRVEVNYEPPRGVGPLPMAPDS